MAPGKTTTIEICEGLLSADSGTVQLFGTHGSAICPGGQKQRLAVACALVGDPELVFLDEPTTGLDPQASAAALESIEGLKTAGRAIILTTHYMDEAERMCGRIAIMDQGRVIALGTPRELIASIGVEHMVEFAVGKGGLRCPPP